MDEDVSSSDHIITFEKNTRIISVNLDLTFIAKTMSKLPHEFDEMEKIGKKE